ncbi:fungal-specific transcription factor domain-containing protein [Entophlyctis helioformis]|nr:fungal-specific transcription factor domain-containing protein [Entophlyctis helioformis]
MSVPFEASPSDAAAVALLQQQQQVQQQQNLQLQQHQHNLPMPLSFDIPAVPSSWLFNVSAPSIALQMHQQPQPPSMLASFAQLQLQQPHLQHLQQQQQQPFCGLGMAAQGLHHDQAATAELVDRFFDYFLTQFPIYPRHEFMATLGEQSPVLINAMCALALTQPASLDHDTFRAGDRFFKQATSILDDFLEHASCSTICALVLLSYYAACSGHREKAYLYSGMAIRMGQTMGLNRAVSHAKAAKIPKKELELRKRVWAMLYILDRSSSLVQTDIPFTIRDEDCDVQVPDLTYVFTNPDGSPRQIDSDDLGPADAFTNGNSTKSPNTEGASYPAGWPASLSSFTNITPSPSPSVGSSSSHTGLPADSPARSLSALHNQHETQMATTGTAPLLGVVKVEPGVSASAASAAGGSDPLGMQQGLANISNDSLPSGPHGGSLSPTFARSTTSSRAPSNKHFSHSVGLTVILSRIMEFDRTVRGSVAVPKHFDQDMDRLLLDDQLHDWLHAQSPWVQEISDSYGTDFFSTNPPHWIIAHRQIMYHYSRLLLHGSRFFALQTTTANEFLVDPSSLACFDAANQISILVSRFMEQNPRFSYVGWLMALGIFRAGIVIIISIRFGIVGNGIWCADPAMLLNMHVQALQQIGRTWVLGKHLANSLLIWIQNSSLKIGPAHVASLRRSEM